MIGAESTGIRGPVPAPAGPRRDVVLIAPAVALVAAACVLVAGIHGVTAGTQTGTFLSAAFAGISGGLLFADRALKGNGYRRLLGVALLLWAVGSVLNGLEPQGDFPGTGDLVSLVSGPFALVGGLLMLRVRSGVGAMWQLGIDGTLLGLALALPVWQFGFAGALGGSGAVSGSGSGVAGPTATLVFTLGALVALAALVGGALLAYLRDLDRNVLLVSVGLMACAAGQLLAMHDAIVGRWSPAGWVLICLSWPLIGAGLVAYRPVSAAERDQAERNLREGLVTEDTRGTRITTGATLVLLFASLVMQVFDPTPSRSSISLIAVAIALFGVREMVNAHVRRELLARLREEATADPLTRLANRRVLAARMRSLPEGESWCLLTVDLDGFKDVNDLLGHAIGDELLSAVARRLRESAPPEALVSRIGGDEFAVLLRGGIDVGERVGGDIVTAVRQSAADVESVARVEVSASVGVAAVHRGGDAVEVGVVASVPEPVVAEPVVAEPVVAEPPTALTPPIGPAARDTTATKPGSATIIDLRDHASHPNRLTTIGTPTSTTSTHSPPTVVNPLSALSASGAALRVAKAAGRNRVEVYDEELATIRRRRLRVEERLRVAVETDAITVRFQPIVDLRRGVVAGAEALARWTDPELGRVDPGEFITVAEQTGLVVALGERVLEETLSTGVGERLFERGLRLSWNVSPVQLRVAGFDRVVHEAIAAHRVPRELLVMEVTEQVLVEEGQAAQTLHRIAKLGVTIAIDDFGTGYSALGYLHRLPADILKIDQSLTSSLVAEPRSRAITRAVIDLGRTVGLSVVVEGVESDQIHDLVRRMGIGYGQGMHYGPAMTGAELGALADRLNTPTG